jgi:hypothetical protein
MPYHYAVSVSNTTATAANIKITQGTTTIQTSMVAPNSVAVITLPYVLALDVYTATSLVPKGAYRLRSDQPVSVYQYNPLEYKVGTMYSGSNDASILLPVNAWGSTYRAISWPTLGVPGFYAITASQDSTTVQLAAPPGGVSATPGAGVAADGTGTVVLNQGDVLQVFSSQATGGDLSGSLITADKPVEVISGHTCAQVPSSECCCDHLEESMPPMETVGVDYLVTAPVKPNTATANDEVVRIMATKDNTTLTYDPPQSGAPTTLAYAGDFAVVASSAADYRLTSNYPIIVGQYMEGENSVGYGDPALSLAVPIPQYRKTYLFHAPISFAVNYVNITALTGTTVMVDGMSATGFTPIGGSNYSVARVPLSNAGNGTHNVSSASPVGITVYGYGDYTAYWYPGGQDLRHL